MSEQKIKKAKYFLNLLLDSHTQAIQSRALLDTIDEGQLKAICVILLNLSKSIFPNLSKSSKKLVKQNQKFINKILNKKLTVKYKYKLISKDYKKVLKLLLLCKPSLQGLI